MLFLNRLQENCQLYADKTAIEFQHSQHSEMITYGQLETMVQKTMAYLQWVEGVQAGDRVALQLPKCLPFIYLHLAIMRLGAITLPLNPAYPEAELSYFLEDSGAKVFFADSSHATQLAVTRNRLPTVETLIFLQPYSAGYFESLLTANVGNLPEPPTDAHQTAMMLYTSGTTGRPKGAQITHGNLTANIEGLYEAWGWQESDVLLHVLPLFHVHGLVVALHGALHAGATTIMLTRFEPKHTLDMLVEKRCTVFMAVPTIHKRLVDFPDAEHYDLSHMRLFTSGSDRLADDVFNQFKRRYGHTLLERYGMTETGMNLSNPLHGERRVGSVGLPLPGVQARIAHPDTDEPLPDGEIGEVQVKGAHVFKGYWNMPDKTAEAFTADGWLRTGDMGLREADGYFTLKGRSKDLIITGGYNVYPPEVELVLTEHPAVQACAVFGCPDAEWGEQVVAAIILKMDTTSTERAIIDFCRERLAAYKVPRRVLFVTELPMNALGKVQKVELRKRFCES
jgi:malonyl-CoA/methylmalonyl-CoA synthetase